MAKIITDANIAEQEATGLPLVLDFSATWCGPCKKIAPYVDELSEEYDGRVIIGKVDVDENDGLTSKYGIRNVPTLIFIKNGEVVDKHVGAASKADLAALVEKLL